MRKKLTFLTVILAVAGLFIGQAVLAQDDDETAVPAPIGSPLHPTFPLLDQDGVNVLESGESVSTMNTCGGCHDTTFIAEHSFHADVGLSEFGEAGSVENGRICHASIHRGRWSNPGR